MLMKDLLKLLNLELLQDDQDDGEVTTTPVDWATSEAPAAPADWQEDDLDDAPGAADAPAAPEALPADEEEVN